MTTITNIKGLIMFAFAFISCSVLAQEKTEIKLIEQQSNGVKVYEQVGVPNTSHLQIEEPRKERTLSDWTSDECELAIDQINEKIAQLPETEESLVQISVYREEIERIKKHLSTITTK